MQLAHMQHDIADVAHRRITANDLCLWGLHRQDQWICRQSASELGDKVSHGGFSDCHVRAGYSELLGRVKCMRVGMLVKGLLAWDSGFVLAHGGLGQIEIPGTRQLLITPILYSVAVRLRSYLWFVGAACQSWTRFPLVLLMLHSVSVVTR
ncbi:hypothetical protein BDU57DRAFT_286337 [Ampelomyces quisqualis]|uniref:Uncharacterized protein n=1 Tax=Ampelomyces quisqualis TaxID=50730 RepID=A0A6A5QFT9_AMPQU|nr:hypothetical protein BDU57DRAFT_286337 [Ampelomyces quisqualis]